VTSTQQTARRFHGTTFLPEFERIREGWCTPRQVRLFTIVPSRRRRSRGAAASECIAFPWPASRSCRRELQAAGVLARQIADVLYATARGLKRSCSSPAEFAERFAARVVADCRRSRMKNEDFTCERL
jgi:hypothetical protein